MEADPFDDVLHLEDQFYAEGHELGVKDGSKAGRLEGRAFGLEKGFEKFMAIGELHGRAAVWAARLAKSGEQDVRVHATEAEATATKVGAPEEVSSGTPKSTLERSHAPVPARLPPIASNSRLEKHIRTLYALVEPASMATSNDEEAVSEFDDRLRRAVAKAKVIEKILGEDIVQDGSGGDAQSGPLPDASRTRMPGSAMERSDNIEDFAAKRGST